MKNKLNCYCSIVSISFFLFSNLLTAQDIEWQQVLGGVHSEYLYDLKATPDYGFLLAGSSFSADSGNKSGEGQGDLDYFLWKMDEAGKMEWQKTFGGLASDYLYSVSLTSEGGFILGGSSNSPKSGDKLEYGFGNMDFWILKLDPTGEEEWQITLGGIGNDQLQSIQQTPDGGFIIGGSSDSSPIQDTEGEIIGNKSEESRGSFDYWIIKLSANGEVEWEKTFGGMFADQLKTVLITEDGYLVGGTSNSFVSGNKSAQSLGMSDYWVIKLDLNGDQQWQRTYGGEGDETLAQIVETNNGFLIAGSSNSKTSENKKSGSVNGTDFWVLEIDKDGEVAWDNTYDTGKWDILVNVTKAEDNTFLLGGYASSETLHKRIDNKGINDFIAIKINYRGEMLWSKTIGGTGTDQLKGLAQTRDGGYILAGNSDSKKSDDKDKASIGGNDYWVMKLGDEKKQEEERQLIEIYPNPTYQYTNIIISQDFKEAEVQVFNLNGQKLQQKKLLYRSTPVDLQSYPPGVYILKIIIDGQITDVKVIKKGNI
ncbi:T9SS type A sorting domain-containing protein [Moheibacter lacus]|uniref:T9SS type A sorting domain-containing protein n=1 Tax=Moheibacter lacus TaxID=2745851 RepID=A0A838ZTW8_9FLAO|nr:T9SS type A sorting domain-containing protein [Moheibacter lacus]MBA5630383.1 T9SS type A sorting domain-containing protein [Moheibacter lacus]